MIRAEQRGRGAGLTLRAVAIGITASVLVAFMTAWAELVVRDIAIGILQFPPAAFGMFVIVILANRLVRMVRPAARAGGEGSGGPKESPRPSFGGRAVAIREVDSGYVCYLTSAVPPASSRVFLATSASSLLTPSWTAFGTPSTSSLASLSPRLVSWRTALMT